MIVVADTGPLNYLIQLGHVAVIRSIYGRVIVPPSVISELTHSGAPKTVREWANNPPPWLEVRAAGHCDSLLFKILDLGEAEAISLALELNADALLIDEKVGRKEAVKRGIAITGTLAILLRGALAGAYDLHMEIGRLRHLGFHVDALTESRVIGLYREAQR